MLFLSLFAILAVMEELCSKSHEVRVYQSLFAKKAHSDQHEMEGVYIYTRMS